MANFIAGLVIVAAIAGPSGIVAYLITAMVIVSALLGVAVLPWMNNKL